MNRKNILIAVALIAAAALAVLFLTARHVGRPSAGGAFARRGQPAVADKSPGQQPPRDVGRPSVGGASSETPSDELTPEMIERLTTATARILRADGSALVLRSVDGEFERVRVEPNEVLTVRLNLRNLDPQQPVLIEADHGGSLNRRLGPLVVQPKTKDEAIEFQYAVGGHRGKYTLIVCQGDRQELLEFRAGPEPPTGQAGPPRSFNPEDMQARRSGT